MINYENENSLLFDICESFVFVWYKPVSSNSFIKLITPFLKEQNGHWKGVGNLMPLLRFPHLQPVFQKSASASFQKGWMAPSEVMLSN
jgi:hypothetical protein